MNQPRSCADWKPDLIALLDGELDSARKAEVTAHLSLCTDCQGDLAEIQSTSAFVRRWEPAEPPRDLGSQSFAGHGPWRAATSARRRVFSDRRLRDLFLPAGLGAALAAAAVLLLLRVGAVPAGSGREIQALATEVAALRAELAAAESALARARSETRVAAAEELAAERAAVLPVPAGATPAAPSPVGLTIGERAALLEDVAAIIAQSESRQDNKFLFTTDQLARSLAMQRREDLATIERQLRDARAETFQALLSTHERLDRLAQPAVLNRDLPPERELSEEEPKGKDGGQDPHEDRLEPRW